MGPRISGSMQATALYETIGYDPAVEAAALQRLDRSDPDGCRRSLSALVAGLNLAPLNGQSEAFVLLLVDILHQVNRRLYRGAARQRECQARRLALIERFAGLSGVETARQDFLVALERMIAEAAPRPGAVASLTRRAKSLIERRYQQRLSLSSVAARLSVSPNHLARVFRREAGMTLTAYIHHIRLSHARRFLADDGPQISEIAYRVGYRTYRDFYRNFVKYEGASPRQVRQRFSRKG